MDTIIIPIKILIEVDINSGSAIQTPLSITPPAINLPEVYKTADGKRFCKHCKKEKKIIGRGLCASCYHSHREEYPVMQKKERSAHVVSAFNKPDMNKMIWCQYNKCDTPDITYAKKDMIIYDDLFFCTTKCKLNFLKENGKS